MEARCNHEMFESSLEDFEIHYITSDKFARAVNEVILELCEDYTRTTTALRTVFVALWKFDAELLVCDPRGCIQSFLENRAMFAEMTEEEERANSAITS